MYNQVRELNINNILNFLNDIDKKYDVNNSLSLSTQFHYEIIMNLIRYFYNIKKTNYINKNINQYFCSTVLLKENIKNKFLNNVNCIEFVKLYPNVIIKLLESNEVKISVDEFLPVYKFIVNNYDLINKYYNNKNYSLILQGIINSVFAVIYSKFNDLNISNFSKIPLYRNAMFTEIFNDDNVYYVDTDIIILKNMTPSIKNKIDELNLPYKIKNNLLYYFINKKIYLSYDNKLIIKGKGHIKNKTIINNFNNIIKLKKIKKIKNTLI